MGTKSRPYTFDRVARIVIIAICVIGAIWLIDYLSGVLLPFLVACVLAYIINPLVEYNCRMLRSKRRIVPTIITLIEIVAIIIIVVNTLAPLISFQTKEMIALLQQYSKTNTEGQFFIEEANKFIRQYINIDDITKLLTIEEWTNIIKSTLNNTWSFVGSTFSILFTIISWIIVLLYLVFILIDYDKLNNSFHKAIPAKYQELTWSILHDITDVMHRYFRGQALVAFFVGILFSIGFSIIGLPMGLVFGLFVGMLNLVPYLQVVSIPIAILLCLVDSITTGGNFWLMIGEITIVYCGVQVVQDLFIVPRIMGKRMGLNPAIVFLSLSIWGALLGFIGLIIALPLTTLVISYYKRYILGNGTTSAPTSDDDSNQ